MVKVGGEITCKVDYIPGVPEVVEYVRPPNTRAWPGNSKLKW